MTLLGTIAALMLAASAWAYWTHAGAGTANATTSTLNAPTSLTASATPGASTVHLSWTGSTLSSGQPAQGYFATRIRDSDSASFTACGTSQGSLNTGTSCNDLAVPDGSYHYRVTAVSGSWTALSPTSNAVIVDTTAPTVTINQATGQADPTNTTPVNYTVVFSETVTGFTNTDITFTGTAGATTATVTGSGPTYNVAITGMTINGTVKPTIAANTAQDTAGNPNTASTSTDNTVTYDTTAPAAPTALAYTDGGPAPGDKVTGNAEVGSTVTATQTQGPHIGTAYTATTNGSGSFTITVDNVGLGTIVTYSVVARDPAGNTGPATSLGPIVDAK
jgi:hypothetical protein